MYLRLRYLVVTAVGSPQAMSGSETNKNNALLP